MVKRKLIDKQATKHFEKCCKFCGETDYSVLDLHRVFPGSEGGEYTEQNTVVLCAVCHRKVHAGSIIIDRKYLSTSGQFVVHCWISGEEKWI